MANDDLKQEFNKKQRLYSDKEKELEAQIKEINVAVSKTSSKYAQAI